MNYIKLEQELILDYGVRLTARKSKNGDFIIGVGYSGPEVRASSTLSLERAGALLIHKIELKINVLREFLGREFFDQVPEPVKRALVRIIYSNSVGRQALDKIKEPLLKCNWTGCADIYMTTDHAKNNPRRAEGIRLAFLNVNKD